MSLICYNRSLAKHGEVVYVPGRKLTVDQLPIKSVPKHSHIIKLFILSIGESFLNRHCGHSSYSEQVMDIMCGFVCFFILFASI